MTIVTDAIAEGLAALERVQDHAVEPFGYGSDLACSSDLTPGMAEVSGDSIAALSQAIVRRLDCPRGALPDDPDYGIDLRSYCNRGTTADEIRGLATSINGELTKDDRIDRVVVTLTPSPTGSAIRVHLDVTPIDHRVGGFSLTLSASSAAVLIEEIGARA